MNEKIKNIVSTIVENDATYSRRLTHHIVGLLQKQQLCFCEIVSQAGGAYPTNVQNVLKSLLCAGIVHKKNDVFSISKQRLDWLVSSDSYFRGLYEKIPSRPIARDLQTKIERFADPHPADYDWRFSTQTLGELNYRLNPYVGRCKIALFGTTTLFPILAASGADVMLYDKSKSLLNDLVSVGFKTGLVHHDLFLPVKNNASKVDLVVADPPWYSDFFKAFTLRAAEILKDEGLLFLSVLPWLTRPSALEDRSKLLEFATDSGFVIIEVVPNTLRYQTPIFEKIVLSKEEIECDDWRTGDLFVFRKFKNPSPKLKITTPKDEPIWQEFTFGRKKVKLRQRDEPKTKGLSLKTVSENGPFWGYVSRRAPSRSKIDLWTSDNVAYSVEGIKVLREALILLQNGEIPGAIVKQLMQKKRISNQEGVQLEHFLREVQ